MKQAIRLTAILLAAVLTVGLLPAATLAADSPWASDAAARLNTLYGVNVFSADDGAMTEGEVAAVCSRWAAVPT